MAAYAEMIEGISIGAHVAPAADIYVRLRPDSGLNGINAVFSKSEWRRMAFNLPDRTVRRYGTFNARWPKPGGPVNGDNVFAAQRSSFRMFVDEWLRLVETTSNQSDIPERFRGHVEWSMDMTGAACGLSLQPPLL